MFLCMFVSRHLMGLFSFVKSIGIVYGNSILSKKIFKLKVFSLKKMYRYYTSTYVPQQRNVRTTTMQRTYHNNATYVPQQRNVRTTTTQRTYHNNATYVPQQRNVRTTTTQRTYHNKTSNLLTQIL